MDTFVSSAWSLLAAACATAAISVLGCGSDSLSTTGTTGGPSGCTSAAQCDDDDACTDDSCVLGKCLHDPSKVDDGDACTTDSCDKTKGAVHTPVDMDDKIACTKDACDGKTGMVSHTPDDTLCMPNEHCAAAGCTDQLDNPVISEFVAIGTNGNQGELIEIYNPNGRDAVMTGYAFTNLNGDVAVLHDALDPTGSGSIKVAAKDYVYGVASPLDAMTIPFDATFVYGDPGTAWSMADAGDKITLVDSKMKALDVVDFTMFATDLASNVAPAQFPGSPVFSTQLDVAHLDEKDNDSGDNWCLSFRVPHTRGTKNGSCQAFVVNEVLASFVLPGNSPGTNQNTFIELAGPGGGNMNGIRVLSFKGGSMTTPSVTIGTGPKSPVRMPLDGLLVIADGDVDDGITNVPNADMIVGNGVPPSGNSQGQTIRIVDPLNFVIDAFGYGQSQMAEGNPTIELSPDNVPISYARDEASTDTDNNLNDFHYDPTATPGEPNLPVAPKIVGYALDSPTDGLASTTTTVTLLVSDFADFRNANGNAPADNDVNATFITNATPDTASFTDGCTWVSIADSGRGVATIKCTAPANANAAARGDLILDNPALIGGTATLPNGWTYTGVNNKLGAPAEIDLCSLESPPTLMVQQGMITASILGLITQGALTPPPGSDGSILAQVGYGKAVSNPTSTSNWVYFDATWNQQSGQADEYTATMLAPAVIASTQFSYVYRFSLDGGLTFTYCDLAGDGSTQPTNLTTNQLGTMTVTP